MAKLMLRPYNLLALDEPTNHMDIRSKDVLKQALQAYDGTIIIVSHDRDFLDGLVEKVYEFRDGHVSEHLGGIQDYLYRRKMESLSELERHNETKVATAPEAKSEKTERKEAAVPSGKGFVSKEERKIRQQIAKLEEIIESKEKELKEIEAQLTNPADGADIMGMTENYLQCKSLLDARTAEWEQLIESLG